MALVEEETRVDFGSTFPPVYLKIIRKARSDDWLSLGVVRTILPDDWDPNYPHAHDGQWYAVVTLPHEVVEYEGYAVPVFEGDRERIEWERQRRSKY